MAEQVARKIFERMYADEKFLAIKEELTGELSNIGKEDLLMSVKNNSALHIFELLNRQKGDLKNLLFTIAFIAGLGLVASLVSHTGGFDNIMLIGGLTIGRNIPEMVKRALGIRPLVLVGVKKMTEGVSHYNYEVIAAARSNLNKGGRRAEVVPVKDEKELAAIARQRGLTAVFVDGSFSKHDVGTEKFRDDIYSVKLARDYNVILTMNSIPAETRTAIANAIIALLGELARVDFDRAVKEFRGTTMTAEKLAQIDNISKLISKRKAELRNIYNNMPMPSAAEFKKPIAIATTEDVAICDIYLGENINKASESGIKNAFIYGDKLKTIDDARNFVIASGYSGNIEDIVFINKSGLTYEQLVSQIARQTGVEQENVGTRSVEGELKLERGKVTTGKLLEIESIVINDQKVYVAMNSYQALLKLLTAEGEFDIPGVSKDEVRGIFRYLPRAVPIDYEKEVRSHIEAITVIRTAA